MLHVKCDRSFLDISNIFHRKRLYQHKRLLIYSVPGLLWSEMETGLI